MPDTASDAFSLEDLSGFERWLLSLGVRPDERRVTVLLFSNMFLNGFSLGLTRVCAYTLFLSHYGSEDLAYIAILLAVSGSLMTVVIGSATRTVSIRGYLFTLLGIIFCGLVTFRGLLLGSDNPWVIFLLPLWFELAYMLFSLEFTSLLAKLLNVRQTKRLAALARSGEFVAEMVAGLSVALLLHVMAVDDLLILAALAVGGVVMVVYRTSVAYPDRLVVTTQDVAAEQKGNLMGAVVKQPYVRLICACEAAYLIAYFFMDVAFYDYAATRIEDTEELAAFLGRFFALAGLLTLLAMVFVFSPFIRKLGIMAGVIAFPIVVGVGAFVVSAMEFMGAAALAIFLVMIATNGCRFILQSSVWRPSIAILFQVLPDRQRTFGNMLIEGIVDPVAGGCAGVALLLFTDYLGWLPHEYLLVLSAVMVIWIVCGIAIRRHYLSHLVVSLQKRKLGGLVLSELDSTGLKIIHDGLHSDYPAEVLYCLDLLEEMKHPELEESLHEALANRHREVRQSVVERVERLRLSNLGDRLRERMEEEDDPRVLGQLYKSYSRMEFDDVEDRLLPHVEEAAPEVHRGAMVGLLRHGVKSEAAVTKLLELVRSAEATDKIMAARIMGEVGEGDYSGFLVELIDDADKEVVKEAMRAAGGIQDPRLVHQLVDKLTIPVYRVAASRTLRSYSAGALDELFAAYAAPGRLRAEKHAIMDACREIGGQTVIDWFLGFVDIESQELRHHAYRSLASLHHQAEPDDKYIFVGLLDEEVQTISWLLAAMEDLYADGRYGLVHRALGHELDIRRDNMLLLISFLFPSIVMLDTRANIDSKVAELRTFALEVLDNLLSEEIKQIVLPVLDDLTVSERLEALSLKFPQLRLGPEERFDEVINHHFPMAFSWTRTCVLYHIGQQKIFRHQSVAIAALQSAEALERETALWALAEMNPQELRRYLTRYADDPAPMVRAVAADRLALRGAERPRR